MAAEGTYFTLMPVNIGERPLASVMVNVLAGSFERGLRGSLRIFKVSVPVLVTVATSLRFSTSVTVSEPIACLAFERHVKMSIYQLLAGKALALLRRR
jgi:hypothetical protein